MRLILIFLLCSSINLIGQTTTGLILNAESGTPLADGNPAVFEEVTEDEDTYFRVVEDYPQSPDVINDRPGTESRVLEYALTFPAAGTYHLYARMRIGPGNADDDSFYYGNNFGEKDPATTADWIMVNQLASAGFSEDPDNVTGGGTAGSGVWKWLNISAFSNQDGFTVGEDALTQTFRIGSRENGFEIDLLAFLPVDEIYTVEALNEMGGITLAEPNPPLAFGKEKWLGNVYSSAQITDFTSYWNQVTPENAGKWGSVEPQNNQWNFTELDAAYNLAKSNNFPFRFHVLIWGSQQPSWLIDMDPEQQLAEIRQWMDTISHRYPDIDFLEVVNEPLHAPPMVSQEHIDQNRTDYGGYIEALGGSGTTGWDWIIRSFELAREYFPDTKLMINDYNIIGSASNTQTYVGIINLLKERELIDAIGFQAHAFSTWPQINELRNNLNTLAATGLPVMATEMDLDGSTDQEQLTEYQRVFPIFWEHPAIIGITLWGWRPGLWREQASLIRADGTERLALSWLAEYVGTVEPLTSIAISGDQESAVLGETVKFVANINPGEANNFDGLEWSVMPQFGSNGRATIDATGLLKAVSPGVVMVRATATTNGGIMVYDELEFQINGNPNGLKQDEIAGLQIFPNPFENVFKIQLKESGEASYIIYDLYGKQLESGIISQKFTTAGLGLMPAVYVLAVEKDGQRTTFRMVKTR